MRTYFFAAMMAVLALAGGCQSGGGWRWPWQSSGPLFSGGPASQAHASYASAPMGNNPGGAPTMEAGVDPPAPSFFTNPVGAMSAGFSSASKAVQAPFRSSTPTAVDTDRMDPTRLGTPTGPVDSHTLVSWAKLKEEQKDFAGAEEFYRKAIEVNPNDVVALINYGRLFHRQQKWDRAVEVYRRAIQLHPQEPAAYNDLAMCYASQNKLTLGIESLNHAVQLDPSNQAYRSNLAMLLVDAKRAPEALTHLASVYPAEVAHYNLAYLLIERDEKAQAREHLLLALQMKPQFLAAQKLLARTADAPAGNPAASPLGNPAANPVAGPAAGPPAQNVAWPTQSSLPDAGGFYNPNLPGAPAGPANATPSGPAGAPLLQLEGPRTMPVGP